MPSVNTNENDPMNWSWTTPRTNVRTRRTKPILRPKGMTRNECAARAKYYKNRGQPVPPLFREKCSPSQQNCVARAKYYRNQGLVVPNLIERCAKAARSPPVNQNRGVTNRINRAQNAFSILGVPKNSSRSVIRKAYLRLSKQYHPNKGGNANSFRKIKKAYNSLV